MKAGAQRPGGSWMQQNYDKLLLVVALLLLLASAGVLLLRVGGQRKDFDQRFTAETERRGEPARQLDTSSVSNLITRLTDPFQVTLAPGRSLMVGELRVASIPAGAPIAYNATVDPFNDTAQPAVDYDPDSDGDGIPDKVELAMGLDINNPNDARGDLDGDGYSNLEEYQAGTNPSDSASFPPPAAKLRLVRTIVNPFRFRFLGVSKLPDGDRFQLNLRTLERTYFARLGEEIEGFKVASYEDQAPEGPTLVLQQGGGNAIRLIQGRVINQEARTALVVFLLDASRYRVQINDTIQLKDLVYKVVDIREDRIVIRNEQDGKLVPVGLLTADERMALQGGGAPSAAPAAPAFP